MAYRLHAASGNKISNNKNKYEMRPQMLVCVSFLGWRQAIGEIFNKAANNVRTHTYTISGSAHIRLCPCRHVHATSYFNASLLQVPEAYWRHTKCWCGEFYLRKYVCVSVYMCVCVCIFANSMHLSINFLWSMPQKHTSIYIYS